MRIPSILNNSYTRPFLAEMLYLFSTFSKKPLFSDLVLKRKRELWEQKNEFHSLSECENTIVNSSSDVGNWHCCPLWQRKLSNKINAKNFANKLGVPTSKTLWIGKDPNEIPFNNLPESYVIKITNGWSSKQVIPIVCGTNAFTNKSISVKEIQYFFNEILSSKQFWDSQIIVEEFITTNKNNLIPKDYKLYCFHGKVKAIQVIERNENRYVWYSEYWKPFRDQILLNRDYGLVESEPKNLNKMIYFAELLSEAYDYPFIRIDFYIGESGVVFGEFSHTPNTGKSNKLYTPFANKLFGALWTNNTLNNNEIC